MRGISAYTKNRTFVDNSTNLCINVYIAFISSSVYPVYNLPVRLYLGSENPIVSSRKYQGFFTCDFDLTSYPFDHQTCFMKLQLQSAFRDDMGREGSQVQYLGNPLLLEYRLGTFTILSKSQLMDDTILWVSIPMTRLVGYAVISIYLPSLIMLIIGYLTLFFVNDNFEVRVMTALTTLLVMATLFTQVSSSLPKTSYFKLVDVWLLFCIFSTFLIIVFHIIIDLSLHNQGPTRSTTEAETTRGRIPVQHQSTALNGDQSVTPFSPAPLPSAVALKAWDMPRNTPSKARWCQMSVSDIERFARYLMAAVFLVFNIVYWLKAYGFV
ncbi:gamma-aminobutyric acid receptor subunit pi-like [Penaeus chinensis]|uniref:gamma-aminobutyric acid receptor subunit pi-like n=1 Tax=Penaeus chinensis TaxID=139456 RepID=UPI001FB85A6B|nr:gamma-aminobutyric acid receptor subunit pi-like [Penaeus chinensis]